jgi:DNA-binding transcriptional MerR regulator
MQIGVVAERLGLSQRTLHHWEEAGLVTPSARTAGGFRLYTEADVARLIVIRRMKPLGFSLDEMRGILIAFDTLRRSHADASAIAEAEALIDDCRKRVATQREELRRLATWADEFQAVLAKKTF